MMMFQRMYSLSPHKAAVVGAACIIPFSVLNAIVGSRIEPFFSLMRPGEHTSPQEYLLLAVSLLFLLLGAYIAAVPMFRKGKRKVYALNALIAIFLFAVFVLLTVALGSEIYQCNVLGVVNCD